MNSLIIFKQHVLSFYSFFIFRKNTISYRKIKFENILLVFLVSLLISCTDTNPPINTDKNLNAVWNKTTSTLSVSGETEKSQNTVQIHDVANGRLLGAAIVNSNGRWAASATTAACSVHVSLPSNPSNVQKNANQKDNIQTIKVTNAPDNCTANSTGVSGRAATLEELPINIKVVSNPSPNDTIPNAVILAPSQNLNIATGTSVNFRGVAVGIGVTAPFSYRWDFSGAAPNSGIQNPGAILFNTPGTYFIELTVTDNVGIPDPTPASVSITVSDPNTPTALPPVPMINAPSVMNNSIEIFVGEALFFSGTASNDVGAVDFMFEWDFSGAVPNEFGATPGSVVFSQIGVYLIHLYATDAQGLRSPTPATITVTVNDSGINQSPSGSIIEPANDIVLNIGDTINFTGLGTDPDMNSPLFYSWNFQGAAPNINMNPSPVTGPITFTRPGIFTVTLTVTDALGEMDANPPSRIIIVQDNILPPAANGAIQSQIISPPNKVKVLPGDSVYFSGEIIGDIGNQVTQYLWDFDGGAVASNLLTPGDISFSLPGKYAVTFYALDDTGVVIGEPAITIVKVHDPSKVEAEIESPAKKQIILANQAILLDGRVEHLLGGMVGTYEWRIKAHGATEDLFHSLLQAPGTFIFPDIGKYHVYFKITGIDILGVIFERTDKVTVNVTLATSVTPPNGSPIIPPIGGAQPLNPPIPNVPVVVGSPIMVPIADMVINVGSVINFQANMVDPSATNVTYRWDFTGASPASNLAAPPAILFNTLGQFLVHLRISGLDQNGIPFDLLDTRMILVINPNTPPLLPPPPPAPLPIPSAPPTTGLGGISVPPTDMVINEGDTIGFRGVVLAASNVTYLWDFAGIASTYTGITPPPVQFNMPGTFLVSLKITGTHVTGAPINVYNQRAITVIPAAQPLGQTPPINPTPINNMSPEGFIIKPESAFINVKAGQSIVFAGAGFDPLGLGPLTFQWNFGGALTNIQTQNPGTISFNRVGTHVVTLLVRNAVGEFDPTPATVIINVTP